MTNMLRKAKGRPMVSESQPQNKRPAPLKIPMTLTRKEAVLVLPMGTMHSKELYALLQLFFSLHPLMPEVLALSKPQWALPRCISDPCILC